MTEISTASEPQSLASWMSMSNSFDTASQEASMPVLRTSTMISTRIEPISSA